MQAGQQAGQQAGMNWTCRAGKACRMLLICAASQLVQRQSWERSNMERADLDIGATQLVVHHRRERQASSLGYHIRDGFAAP